MSDFRTHLKKTICLFFVPLSLIQFLILQYLMGAVVVQPLEELASTGSTGFLSYIDGTAFFSSVFFPFLPSFGVKSLGVKCRSHIMKLKGENG